MRLSPVFAILGLLGIVYAMPLVDFDSQVTRRGIFGNLFNKKPSIELMVRFEYGTGSPPEGINDGTNAARKIVKKTFTYQWGVFLASETYVKRNGIKFTLEGGDQYYEGFGEIGGKGKIQQKPREDVIGIWSYEIFLAHCPSIDTRSVFTPHSKHKFDAKTVRSFFLSFRLNFSSRDGIIQNSPTSDKTHCAHQSLAIQQQPNRKGQICNVISFGFNG
ncbi:hypothetical protein BDP27DRAFT_1402631 [Rhodocollybia butyracea]|uniref:Uncharacterized protein n=1 Tax=Rhodocollybia butyracea TaxID=206335 RepID=A0A9P5U806_9AGAR|nr:hypothetical protein BDP27DRAFT_1402631 [Rhodocollybia butyracea]